MKRLPKTTEIDKITDNVIDYRTSKKKKDNLVE